MPLICRAVAEIQKNIIELGKRNPISRLFHAKDDGDAIAAWRLELHQILHVFNVCPVTLSPTSLTIRFQTELAINTHIAVSEIHRTAVERQGGTNDNGSGLLVSNHRNLSTIELILIFSQTQTRFAIYTAYRLIVLLLRIAYPENPHLRRRGLVSGAVN